MSARLSSRIRRIVVAVLAVVGLVVGGATPALAGTLGHGGRGSGGTYLALGDSVAFGYRGNLPAATYLDPRNFAGYPELVARDRGLRLLNASCPGETTDSFIDATRPSNGCENKYRLAPHTLHVDYVGSQLAYAVAALRAHRDVKLVSIDLGANDGFLCQAAPRPYCSSGTDTRGIAAHVRQNLARILTTLRTEGHYRGRIVVLDYYALDYSNSADVQSTLALDRGIDRAAFANRARVASGFAAFLSRALRAGGSSIAAGLVLPNVVHPTPLGHRLLANAVERAA